MDGLIVFGAKYLIFLIGLAALALAVWKFKPQSRQFIGALIIAGVTAIVLAKIAGKFYYHPRPFVSQNIKPLFAHSSDNGFPSEHTIAATAIATVVYLYHKKAGAGLMILAIIVGLSRVAAHVHSLVDIAGGLVLGLVAGWIGFVLAKKYITSKPSVD